MEHSEKEEFIQKLVLVLKKILESTNVADIYVDKILTSIDDELRAQHSDINMSIVYEWLAETIQNWKKSEIGLSQADFMCKFIGLLSKYSELFDMMQSKNVLNDLISLLKNDLLKPSTMKITFIKMLSAILDNNSGCTWIRTSEVWKLVVSIYFSNTNLYVEREAIIFFKKLILKAESDDNSINEEIIQYIFLPIKENLKTAAKDKTFNSNILLLLKLLETILKENIFSKNNSFHLKAEKICNIEAFLKSIIENSEQDTILEAALVSQVLYSILKFEDKKKVLSAEDIPSIFDLFNLLLRQNQFHCIVKLAKYCQILWNEMSTQMHCENTIGVNFIAIQLLPSLMSINTLMTDKEYDLFMKKLFTLKATESQKFFHSLGRAIKSNCGSKPNDLAVKSILSVTTNLESCNLEEVVLILQAMLFISKSIIFDSGYDLETAAKKFKKLGSTKMQDNSLLSAILNGVSLLLEKFKINWTDLEALGLFKITYSLLKFSELPSLAVVQTLLVIKVAILNCIVPGMVSTIIQSSFNSLMPVLYELMTNSNWEVRDSCIEVVIAIAELTESKYPTFEQVLLERDFRSLLLNIIENDTESYVRASAIRALTVMTKVELLNPFLNDQDSCLKITRLVEAESEGIVRREAALLIKEIYLTLNDQHSDLINLFYRVMGSAALCDLHWEVKINSLVFWEAVIERLTADQTMISESLSNSVSLNTEIINLSKDEVKLGLEKSLRKLSKIGCLHILLTILKDDCDMIVIKKAAEVLSGLLSILKCYNVLETDNISLCNAVFRKRKNSDLMGYEKKKIPSNTPDINSDGDFLQESSSIASVRSEKIIEEIVNDTDINLIRNVSSESEEIDDYHKSTFLKEIEPEVFLKQVQGFDKDKFLENKQKWFMNLETDLTLTMDKINIEHSVNEINVMDCY